MEPITLQSGEQLDPKVVKVMKAIRTVESGAEKDPYNAVGDGGKSHGAYQWLGDNWKNAAKQVLGDENAPMTPANQNKVAYNQIKGYKDAGRDPEEIAALWNGAKKDKATGRYTYNNPDYGKKFRQALMGNAITGAKTAEASTKKYITEGAGTENLPEVVTKNTGFLGTNPNDSTYGKIIDNSLTRGLINIVPGAKTLGDYFGTSFGGDVEKIKGLVGKGNAKYYDETIPSPGKLALATAETLGTAYGVASGGVGLMSLKNKAITKALPYVEQTTGIPAKVFSTLNRTEQLNALGQSLKNAQLGDAEIISNAIKVLKPTTSWIKKTLVGLGLTAGGAVLDRILGGKAASVVKTGLGLLR